MIGALSVLPLAWGCGIAPPIRPVCRDAGFGDAEVQGLLPDIQAARDAGATREEVLSDAAAACAACAEAEQPCVQSACEECFAHLVDEVYLMETEEESPSRQGG